MNLSMDIKGAELVEKVAEIVKPMLNDERIPKNVRDEYKNKIGAAIDSHFFGLKEETK